MGLTRWTNNHVVVVESPDRADFAAGRGVAAQRLLGLSHIQWDADRKAAEIGQKIESDHHGCILRYVNRRGHDGTGDLVSSLLELFPGLSFGEPGMSSSKE